MKVIELDGPDDCAQATDLARQHVQKLAEMQRQWMIYAEKYNVAGCKSTSATTTRTTSSPPKNASA
jgi:hypothetical protein